MVKAINQIITWILLLLEKFGLQRATLIRYRRDPIGFLREHGATVGERCRIYMEDPGTEPYLLEIGDHVSIGNGVQLITHDGALWVLRDLEDNQKLNRYAPIRIGNNVFIGNETIVMPGTTIGDNVIVGANSVVTNDLPSNQVYAGVPTRRICTIGEYREKHLAQCINTKFMTSEEKKAAIIESLL